MSEFDLPDVNVLVALLSANHLHHTAARDWFASTPRFATTPITVLPFWLWASSRLAREGVRRPAAGLLPGAAAMLAGGLAGSFGVAALVQRGARGRAT